MDSILFPLLLRTKTKVSNLQCWYAQDSNRIDIIEPTRKRETIFMCLIILYNWWFYSLFIFGCVAAQSYNPSVFIELAHCMMTGQSVSQKTLWNHRKHSGTVGAKHIMRMKTGLSGSVCFPSSFFKPLLFLLLPIFKGIYSCLVITIIRDHFCAL